MKVLVLLADLFDAVGGIQTFNRALVKALDEIARNNNSGLSVLVLNDTGASPLLGRYCDPAHTIYRGFNGSKTNFMATALREARRAETVILGHVNFSPLVTGLRVVNPRLSILLAVYGIEVWEKLPAFQRLSLKKIDRILSISKSTRDKLATANNLNGTPVDIFPCTLEPFYGQNVRLHSRSDLGLPDGKMILTTSRLDRSEGYKRIEDVIAALPAVIEDVPNAFYVVVGDGTDRARLEQLARDHKIADRIHFVGRIVDDILASYYNACDVFVLPSTREGFGIVLLEAMYYAKPCIGARAGSIPEVIEEDVTGLLHEPNEVDDLAETMSRLLLDDDLRVSIGKAGRERLQQQFSFQMFLQRLTASLSHV